MSTDIHRGLPDEVRLPHEPHHHSITPYFRHMSVLNVAQSEMQGKPVYDLREVVELRFAGDRNYAPVFPSDAQSHRIGTRVITFAERFSDQYVAFVAGDDQKASGTALELLADYGITPAQLSICRALRIYSIEALNSIEGHQVKSLGMHANVLKAMARKYMETSTRRSIESNSDEMEKLKAELEKLRSLIPSQEQEPSDEEFASIVEQADAEFDSMTDFELKQAIKDKTGAAPRGQPSREWLLNTLKELAA